MIAFHDNGIFYVATIMTALKGTEKQVSWAEDIRAGKFRDLIKAMEKTCQKRGVDFGKAIDEDHGGKTMRAVLEALAAKDDAKFWIDNRSESGMMLLRACA